MRVIVTISTRQKQSSILNNKHYRHSAKDIPHSGRGESKRPAIQALSEPYPLVTIRARKMNELKVPISADKGSH